MSEDKDEQLPELALEDPGEIEAAVLPEYETRPKYQRRKDKHTIPKYEPVNVNLTPHERALEIPAKLLGTIPVGYTLIDVHRVIQVIGGLSEWQKMGYHKREKKLAEVCNGRLY